MLTLARAGRSRGSAGEPLPTVFRTLSANGVEVRRGQFTLVAAAPGVGKSVFATSVALKVGVPGFYFSADTDAFTMYLRAAAMLTGWSVGDIEHAVEVGNTAEIDTRLNQHANLRFDFSGRIEMDALEEELKAYACVYGEWPHVIAVDNLSNLEAEGDGYQALEAGCDYLHELARMTGAAVIGLHHVTGEYDDGTKPVPLSGLRGKVSKVPEVVLTLYRDAQAGLEGHGTLYVCPVKNRTGRADPSGNWSLPLQYEPPRMRLADYTHGGSDGGQ